MVPSPNHFHLSNNDSQPTKIAWFCYLSAYLAPGLSTLPSVRLSLAFRVVS